MTALLAPPPMPPLCTAAADGGACQNAGVVVGVEGSCGCDCAGTGFSGAHCALSAEAVGRASQMLGQVTAKPAQLSPSSTDLALAFVAAFDVGALDDGAVRRARRTARAPPTAAPPLAADDPQPRARSATSQTSCPTYSRLRPARCHRTATATPRRSS